MKFALNLNKLRKLSPRLLALTLGINYCFFSSALHVYADLPSNNTHPKRILLPPRAAGKPGPYQASSSLPVVISGSKSGAGSKLRTAASKPSAYASSSTANPSEQMVLQSREVSSYGPVWQSFSDYLTVPKGCDKAPFYLTFTNGTNNNPRFQDVRVKLAGKALATLRDFAGQNKLTRNLSGAIGVGDSLLVVQVYGPAGAQLTWQFTTPRVEVTGVTPKEIALNKSVTITGKNFSDIASNNQVYFGKTLVTVSSAKKTQLVVQAPSSLLGGKADLVVAVGPSRSKPYQVTVKSVPKINSVNMVSTAPGQPITITGEGFSSKSAENQVLVGGVPAEIVSTTPNSITCIVPVPTQDYPTWGVPIVVKTNGVDSIDPEGRGTINIQSRVFDNSTFRP